MIKNKTSYIYREGKIKRSILIITSIIIVFFIIVILTKSSPSKIIPSSITSTTTSSTTSNTLPAATTTVVNIPPTPPALPPNTQVLPPQPVENIDHEVGIAAGGGLAKMNITEINKELDQMVDLGIKWVRFDIEWGDVQYSSPNSSNWSGYDAFVNAVVAHHLNALGIILFTPQWARDPSCGGGAKCPPKDPATFATFAAEVAARYKNDGLHYWEIWNEPNNYDFWATKTDCNAYTDLLKATYPAIKNVDPSAVIISGGLAPETTDKNNVSQLDFLSCIYKDGGKNYFDAMGDHSYTFPNLPSSSNANIWAQMSLTSPNLRSIMIANGDANKKIWITEFGTPTNGPDPHWYMSEAGQSQMVTDAMDLYKTYDWAGPLFWYTLKDGGTSTSTIENFFGLVRSDGSLKPAYTTLKNIISSGL